MQVGMKTMWEQGSSFYKVTLFFLFAIYSSYQGVKGDISTTNQTWYLITNFVLSCSEKSSLNLAEDTNSELLFYWSCGTQHKCNGIKIRYIGQKFWKCSTSMVTYNSTEADYSWKSINDNSAKVTLRLCENTYKEYTLSSACFVVGKDTVTAQNDLADLCQTYINYNHEQNTERLINLETSQTIQDKGKNSIKVNKPNYTM